MKFLFDVTELFYGSQGRLNHGIHRVVSELAVELSQAYPQVIFVTLPRSGAAFRMVTHQDVLGTIRSRQHQPPDRRGLKRLLHRLGYALVRASASAIENLKDDRRSQLTEPAGVLVSCSRPRLMRHFLENPKLDRRSLHFIPLLHDVFPLRNPEGHRSRSFSTRFQRDTSAAISAASIVLTNSRFTASEIKHFSDIGVLPPLPRLDVIQLCHELRENESASHGDVVLPAGAESDDYFLIVGASTGRKNVEVVFQAALLLKSRGVPVPDLILSGRTRQRVIKLSRSRQFAPLSDHIRFVSNPSEQQLRSLYRNAKALIMPSKSEGWGFPAAEALWMGTPVIAADTEIMREVCADRAAYFAANDATTLSELMIAHQNVAEPSVQTPDRSDLRSWSDVARDLLTTVWSLDPPQSQ